MKEIKDIAKNRFLVWLMWLMVVGSTGWLSISIWTIIQLYLFYLEIEKLKYFKMPVKERSCIAEMNMKDNLTDDERLIMEVNTDLVKIGEGVFIYENK